MMDNGQAQRLLAATPMFPDSHMTTAREPKSCHVMQVANGFVVSVSDVGGTSQYIARSAREIAKLVRAHFSEEEPTK